MAASAPVTAVVMAAGKGTRWGDYRGTPKHLLEVDGEPILHRTVRLLREHIGTVWVVGPNDAGYHQHGANIYTVEAGDSDADKFYSGRDLWNGHTLLVYGDCWFSDEAIAAMCGPVSQWTLFCRPGPSAITGSRFGECWGFSVPAGMLERFRRTVVWLAGMTALGESWRCGGWELYRALLGQDLGEHRMTTNWQLVDDWTEDFDYPADFDMWLFRRYAAAARN